MRRRDFLRAAAATALAACTPTTTPGPTGDLVDSMSLERKVGQLMSVAFHGTKITSSLEGMIRDRGIGGVILYSENFADAAGLVKLVADLDQIARDAKSLPLFFEIDQEGGPVIRINKGATILPGQMALAATADPERSVRTAAMINAAELRAFGVNWNFAPVADVNDEPTNPIISNRSFSSDPARVSLVVTADLGRVALTTVGEAPAGLRAIQAGADYLLFRFDESAQLEGHRLIADAVRSGSVSSARLDQSVRRLVDAKRRFGILDGRRDQSAPDLAANARTSLELARGATTLLRNRGVLPLRGRILAVSPTNADISFFEGQATLGSVIAAKRADAVSESLPLHPSASEIDRVVSASRAADVVVVGTTNLFAYPEQVDLVRALAKEKPVAVVALRGPYDILSVPEIAAYLCAYDSREPSLVAAAEVLLGERKPAGSLPAVVPGIFSIGAGMRDFA